MADPVSASLMDDDVFRAFTTYATIVILKMMLMSPLTAYHRITKGSFANEEDAASKASSAEEKKKLMRSHPSVERVRRGHLNDLENVIPFVLVGFLYALTGPDLHTALIHFRVFAGSRILHTLVYVLALPQPSRGLAWMVGFGTTLSMVYRVLSTVLVL